MQIVYLDNCCYNRPYDDQSQPAINLETIAKLEIQQQIREGKILLVTSYVLLAENRANPFEAKRNAIAGFINKYTYTYVSKAKEKEVNRIAEDIMKTGVKLMDASHVACAIIAGCDYFVSTDKRLLKYRTEQVQIVNPVEYILGL